MKNLKFTLVLLIALQTIFASNDAFNLNVMTYNIQQGSNYITSVTPEAVSKIILKHDVDLLGTQELHIDGIRSLANYLPDYGWFGVGRDNGKDIGETGVIFFKKDKFKLLEQNTFWLSETPEIPGSKSWNTDNTRIVTWGKFKLKDREEIVFLFNTHFDHISSWAREESSKLLLKKIAEIAGKNPVLITGDFNFNAGSNAYNLLVDSYHQYLKIDDSFFKAKNGNTGPSGTYNGYWTDNPSSKIDFVFANPYFDVFSNEVITDKRDGEFISDHFPVKSVMKMKFPEKPCTPVLKAVAGDNKVMLTWDNNSEINTLDTFADTTNDFQGYKLYRSKTPDMSDALLINGKWDVPMLRVPLFECDKIDEITGHTNYGIQNGFGYYLGSNTGLQHFYVDKDVNNGEKYYYVLIAHDRGVPDMADGIAPLESPVIINVDSNGDLFNSSANVAQASPKGLEPNSEYPGITFLQSKTFGKGQLKVNVIDPEKVFFDDYRVEFTVDTINQHAEINSKYRSDRDIYYVNSGMKVISESNDSIVYAENIENFTAKNIMFNPYEQYYYLNNQQDILTEEFEGIQIELKNLVEFAAWDSANTGWANGNADIKVQPSVNQSKFFPYDYEIIFGQNYSSKVSTSKGVYDAGHNLVGSKYLVLNQTFDFKVVNKNYNDEELDIVGFDSDNDETFDILKDQVLVGYSKLIGNKWYWCGTVFSISFASVGENYPEAGDVYEVTFHRPFSQDDQIVFNIEQMIVGIDSPDENTPGTFRLNQNYPNPFNPSTTISFQVFKPGQYSLKVYNMLGQLVETIFDKEISSGVYTYNFNGSNLASGVYVYALQGVGERVTRKMMLVK